LWLDFQPVGLLWETKGRSFHEWPTNQLSSLGVAPDSQETHIMSQSAPPPLSGYGDQASYTEESLTVSE
jgi:hypothetical protein